MDVDGIAEKENFDGIEIFLQNESAWDMFFSNTPDCVLDMNFETHKLNCSASLARNLRLMPQAIPRTLEQWLELCHPDDYTKVIEFRGKLLDSSTESFSLERRLYCGDGIYRLFRMSAACLRDKLGEIKRLIVVDSDLSGLGLDGEEPGGKLLAAENELSLLKSENERLTSRLSQKTLQKDALEKRARFMNRMLDAAADFLFHCDGEGRLLACNEAFSNAMVLSPDLKDWAAGLAKAGEQAGLRHIYFDANGRARTLLAEVERLPLNGGCVGAARDVTETEETAADMERLKRLLGKLTLAGGAAGEGESEGSAAARETSPNEESLNAALESRLQKASRAFASVASLFPTRAAQLENLIRAARNTELEVGVVGITSSGKSAFINAMMGEKLLPEETRATTNLMIRCRKGGERTVTAVYKDGARKSVSGSQLTAAWVESVTSERLNPDNEQNAAFLEWSAPGAALPEGLVLVDTPGLDACDFPEHSELVMRRLLPNLDIVLYVTSIRNRFKTADLELLEAALDQDQRVIFLLSQIDLEQDDMEGGKVVLSRGRKLSSYIDELYQDIDDNFPEGSYLRRASVIAVSSKLAAAYFYDRESEAWSASNFDALIDRLEAYRANLSRCRFEARARRALVLLARAASDTELAMGNLSAEKAKAEESARLEKVRELRDAQRWANAEISAVRNEWRRQLAPDYHLKRLQREIESANTVKGVKDRYELWGGEWAEMVAQMTDRMDRARRSCLDILRKHGISPDDRSVEAIPVKGELPAFYKYILNEPQEVRVRGWFEALEFWPRYSVFFKQKVDKEKMMKSAGEMITERLNLLNGHLSWWENRMREDYCDILYGELSREDVALGDIRRAVSDISASRKAVRQALWDVNDAARGIKSALAGLAASGEGELSAERGRGEGDSPAELVVMPREQDADYGLFSPLLASLEEQSIQSRFMGLDALRGRKRVVLLGLRRHDSLRLLSRLAHDAAFFDSLKAEGGGEIDERAWIFRGSIPPAMPHVKVDLPDTLLRELDVLVAPSDAMSAPDDSGFTIDWNDLFAEWLPVVHLDIARIDSGLSDLARAPYASALAHVEHWVLASGQGALFNARLTDLLTDVPERLASFAERRDYKGRMEFFVYENYDARYTDFMLWGRSMNWEAPQSADAEQSVPEVSQRDKGLLQKWLSGGHDFKFPFSESRMRMAVEGARRKRSKPAPAPDVKQDEIKNEI